MKIKSFFYILLFLFSIKSVFAQSLFDKKYLQSTWYQFIKVDSTGNIYLAGQDYSRLNIIITKLDTSGKVIWNKVTGVPNEVNTVFDMLLLNDQKIILGCTWDEGSASSFIQTYLICLDTSGNFIYTKSIGDTLSGYILPGNLIADSGGFTMTDSYPYGQGLGGMAFIKFDENATIKYERIVADTGGASFLGGDLLKCKDGSYIIYSPGSEDLFIAKMDSNFISGRLVWTQYDSTNVELTNYKLISLSDSDFLVVGNFGEGEVAFIGHVNQNLVCDWIKKFSFSGFQSGCSLNLLDMKQLKDKSWVFIGYDGVIESPCNPIGEHYFLMHTDSAFNPLKVAQLRSGLNSAFPGGGGGNINIELSLNNTFLFTASHIYADSALGYMFQKSPYFDVIRTDTSFSGICITNDTIINTDFDDSTYSFHTYSFVSDTITVKIDTIILPVTDFIPQYGDCSNTALSVPNINKSKEGLSISPNPITSEELTFSYSALQAPAILTIINITGQEIARYQLLLREESFGQYSSVQHLKLPPMSSGMYVARLITKDSEVSKRFVKE